MPGPDARGPRRPPAAPAHPLAAARTATPPARSTTADGTPSTEPAAPAGPRQVDGQGAPYITLAQFIKKIQVVGSGGAAKAAVRAGIATVNDQAEARPGRKLHEGDIVVVAGVRHVVHLEIDA